MGRWWFRYGLGGGFIFYFHPYLGKIPILTNIFQRGWKHQLGIVEMIHEMMHESVEMYANPEPKVSYQSTPL